MNRWNNALVFAEEFLDLGGNLVEPAETREIPGDGETSGEERKERPGNEQSALTEEAMAVRESAREEVDDAQEAPAEEVSRSRTRGPAEPGHERPGNTTASLDQETRRATRARRASCHGGS